MLAVAIQHHFITGKEKPDLMPLPANVDTVVAYAVSPTRTRVKVYTDDEGVREFNISLVEMRRPSDDRH
jgi:hypothetical protein